MKETIVEFLRNQTQENREIIDEVAGIIIQKIPNLKEKIINSNLKYSNASKGSFCKIYIKNQIVILEFKLGKKFKFENSNSINKSEIEKCLENI